MFLVLQPPIKKAYAHFRKGSRSLSCSGDRLVETGEPTFLSCNLTVLELACANEIFLSWDALLSTDRNKWKGSSCLLGGEPCTSSMVANWDGGLLRRRYCQNTPYKIRTLRIVNSCFLLPPANRICILMKITDVRFEICYKKYWSSQTIIPLGITVVTTVGLSLVEISQAI
jgi:hypothetical protein